jgi:hypothetical protein
VPIAAAAITVSLTKTPTPWLIVAALVPIGKIFAVTARSLDRQQDPRSKRNLVDSPGVVLTLVIVAVTAYALAQPVSGFVRANKGLPALERQLPQWLMALARKPHDFLVPPSGVRVVVFLDDRPAGAVFEAYHAVVSAQQRTGSPVEWVEAVVPRTEICNPVTNAADSGRCEQIRALLFLTRHGLRRETMLLRRELAAQQTTGAGSPSTGFRPADLGPEFDSARVGLNAELQRNIALAKELKVLVPSVFANGIQLPNVTPDMFDGIVRYLLKTRRETTGSS